VRAGGESGTHVADPPEKTEKFSDPFILQLKIAQKDSKIRRKS
jgi:hypothetical protein